MPKQDNRTVQSLDRGLKLLGYLARSSGREVALLELTEFLGIDRSSVFRLMTTLADHALVERGEETGSWRLGLGIFQMAAGLRYYLKLTDVAAPFLRRIMRHTREEAHLAVRSEDRAVFIDREGCQEMIGVSTRIGQSESLHCTAIGKALICDMSREELRELFAGRRLRKCTEHTITTIDALAADLEKAVRRGYALDNEERLAGLRCIAAPIYGFDGRIEGAVGISGPRERMDEGLDRNIEAVRSAGREISSLLGRSETASATAA